MNSHALSVLEFPRVLEVVAGFATSDLGARRIRAFAPTVDTSHLEREHTRVAAVRETRSAATNRGVRSRRPTSPTRSRGCA